MVSSRDLARALASMAHRVDPAPVEAEQALASAWALYLESGVPMDPGWHAAAHALREGSTRTTPAMEELAKLDDDAAGVLVLAGGVGSGRSYACARLLWRSCRRATAGKSPRAGRWVGAAELGEPPAWPDRGSRVETWPQLRDRLTRGHLLILDDVGAAGASQTALDRARQLLEARYASGGLTLVSTNITDDARLSELLGARVKDRAEVALISGESLRAHKLAPRPTEPRAVLEATRRLAALRGIDSRLHGDVDFQAETAILEPWLRPQGSSDEKWLALVEAELEHARTQQAAVTLAIGHMMGRLRLVPPPPEDREAELRAAHRAKLDRLVRERMEESATDHGEPATTTENAKP